ncbi:unnamed protein product [Gadus morhua 'NCC']
MLITLLKLAFKQALLGGRVYRLPEYADPVTPGALSFDTDFSAYHRPLSPQLWAAFQDSERAFRAGLNTGPRREKCFACSGDPGEWIRLIKVLYGVFFKNGVFTTVSHRGKQLRFPFMKYVTRILKKFPLYQPLPEPMTSSSAAVWIEGQLCFVRNTVQPQLCIRTQERRSIKVSRNKLASLWQHRRSKVGIKTGCPWSAINFVLAINQWIRWLCGCAPPNVISPNPIQGYADDVQLASREESVIKDMLSRTDTFLDWSGLEIKQSKCAVLYQRRSGGNRWYKSKTDRDPEFSINSEPIRVYDLHETYTYLGHKFNVAGEWKKQVEYMVT